MSIAMKDLLDKTGITRLLKDFKDFAIKGDVVSITVGMIIGLAFSQVTNSLVSDIVMPPIGLLLGRVDFSHLFINLSSIHFSTIAEAKAAGAVTINYGLCITKIINFIVTAFAVFLLVKYVNTLRGQPPPPPPPLPQKDCPYCFTKVLTKATKCPSCTSDLTL